jgi:hypothetical protein
MEDFYKYVLYAVSIILLIILSVVGVYLYKNKHVLVGENKVKVMNCPDYWIEDPNNKNVCINSKNLGTCDVNDMDFSLSKWNGNQGLCSKKKWAMSCNLTWDGITNNSSVKC